MDLKRQIDRAQRKAQMRRDNATAEALTRPFNMRYAAAERQDKALGYVLCTHGGLKWECRRCKTTAQYRRDVKRWFLEWLRSSK